MKIEKWKQDLVKDIRLLDDRDFLDWPGDGNFDSIIPSMQNWQSKYNQIYKKTRVYDFSEPHHEILRYILKTNDIKTILEIGVADVKGGKEDPLWKNTSTCTIIDNKDKDCVYLGIDWGPREFVNDPENNVHHLNSDSRDIDKVKNYMTQLGIGEIDLLILDGHHSINNVLAEWEYTQWLSRYGIVVFHDTNYHPGPHLFINNLDTTKWNVTPDASALANIHTVDWGIGVAWRR